VAGNPDAIAAAANVLPVATPGDNTNALALSAIRDTNISGANDPGEALRSVLGNFADRVKDTENALITSEATASHLDVLQQTVSGVSLDEEMLTLMQFREAFSAAAQVAKAADEMMAEIISLKR
jgi:flagellar hook-associated protein 1 FlgK